MQKYVSMVASTILLSAIPSSACLWDYDTLAMERAQFPTVHEVIVGKFVRHSPAYYQWRIADRTAKDPETQSAADFDDIAVAYDKLKQHEEAIDTVTTRMERWPNERQYEAHANLGTFHIHAGRFEEGLVHISKAIALNPEAHFGREIYQKLLVEYLIQQANEQQDPDNIPKSDFHIYVMSERVQGESIRNEEAERNKAIQGIMGMMRFGNHDSPILLEALGDLLLATYRSDSNMLAARAYLRAADNVTENSNKAALRNKAEKALRMQVGKDLAEIESELASETKEARQLLDRITKDETKWAESGMNLDDKFEKKYYRMNPRVGVALSNRISVTSKVWLAVGAFVALFALTKMRKRGQPSSATAP